jgi:hypothetical protein
MLSLSSTTLDALNTSFFGASQAQSYEELIVKLQKAQEQVLSLMESIEAQKKIKSQTFDIHGFEALEPRYPFIREIVFDSMGVLRIKVRHMPLNIACSNSDLAEEESHAGIYYVTLADFNFDCKIFPEDVHNQQSRNRNPMSYSFKNVTNPVKTRVTHDIKADLQLPGASGDMYYSYSPIEDSIGVMSHPHSANQYQQFGAGNICFGTNPFNRLLTNGITNPATLYNALDYMMLWLQTGNRGDWHGKFITPRYTRGASVPANTAEFIPTVGGVFKNLHDIIQMIFSSDQINTEYMEKYFELVAAIEKYHEDLRKFISFKDHNDKVILNIETCFLYLELIRILRIITYPLSDGKDLSRFTSRHTVIEDYTAGLTHIYTVAYSSLLLLCINNGKMPNRYGGNTVKHILINDLLSLPGCDFNFYDAVYPNSVLHNAEIFKKHLYGPYVLRKLMERSDTNQAYPDLFGYLPEAPIDSNIITYN